MSRPTISERQVPPLDERAQSLEISTYVQGRIAQDRRESAAPERGEDPARDAPKSR
ncbi:hypothetical protein [Poseidonocella sedimentorum]|uniref:Uncharacterized protein n=1 Tax=Poseidonocella sedimentorum TaxID=871652 RepID=A0A1I6DPL6_9RHOB|nr:hypothetical protein [Poseidonocella sedimentorum]SFR07379.1 hypothetical protein SAMN04515673_104219 [Poseidonocella sedimentorum]